MGLTAIGGDETLGFSRIFGGGAAHCEMAARVLSIEHQLLTDFAELGLKMSVQWQFWGNDCVA
jgi:hypothetical protein